MPLLLSPNDQERWSAFYAACTRATPFQSPEWLVELYIRHAKGEPWPLQMPHAFAPLIREKKGLVTTLRLAGADYEDLLCAPGDEALAVQELRAALETDRTWSIANFRALKEDSVLVTGWLASPNRSFSVQTLPHRLHKYVCLPATWTEYETQLGKKLAYKLRAAAGRRDKSFATSSLRRATTETLEEDMAALFELHVSRWTARGETGVFADCEARSKFTDASRALLAAGRLWLYTLWLDGKPASALYCLVDTKAAYYYIGGIDVAYQKHHPGKVLIAQAIQDGIEAGLQEFDFLSGDENYKDDWANAERQVFRLVIGRGVIGKAAVGVFGPIDAWLRRRKAAREAKKAKAWTKPEVEKEE